MGALMGILQAEIQAKIKEKQAHESIYQAGAARTQSGKAAQQQSARDRAVLGLQRAKFARAGVSLDTGSPLTVMVDSATEAALNKANILHKGDLAYFQLHNQADMLQAEANIGRDLSYMNLAFSVASDVLGAYTGGATGQYQSQQFQGASGSGSPSSGYEAYRVGERQDYSGYSLPRVNE
jgi:hypothetical protein